ncbi:dTDP-4-amino-4,6-dideoxy-D-glucose transaminase [Kineosporia sp. NBRC 101731]|nr:dTDP-4-amino-4,6-dideoxygalactose transaminase [Kineosporia sp. NBRC 101731]GLY29212.1 dTDP-4-amino-4,6-dideoxy-D-glucose transaminase [Kineosporia sp. NBRC 101731]
MIPFTRPAVVGTEIEHLRAVVESGALAGNGSTGRACERRLERDTGCRRVLLTPSCTAALELAALVLEVGPGDEVIMPSFTFPSTANAFALRGAQLVFVDVRPDTLNLDETLIEAALTDRTRGIVPVHYAGVGCAMDPILEIARAHGLWVVEDAAQGLGATYRDRALGTLGDIGCLSFHATKGVTAGGEGGAMLINLPELTQRAEIGQEKGTDRSRFQRGEVARYTWQGLGSSHLMSELQAAFLLAQLSAADQMQKRRRELWDGYEQALRPVAQYVDLPVVPPETQHNAHLFGLRTKDADGRDTLIAALREAGVTATTHYEPLHGSPAGRRYGRFSGTDRVTTDSSRRLVRLPLFHTMTDAEHRTVIDAVLSHYRRSSRSEAAMGGVASAEAMTGEMTSGEVTGDR